MARRTKEERMNHAHEAIRQQRESGKSVTAWCKENGVSKSTFYRYVRITCATEETETATTSGGSSRHSFSINGTEKPDVGSAGTMIVVCSGEVTVQIGENASTPVIESVIRALNATC